MLKLLQRLPNLSHISETYLKRLADGAIHRVFSLGQVIFLEGEDSAGLWALEKGHVKVYKLSRDGQEYILRFLGPGEIFNELAALDNAPNAASAMAVTDVEAWVISGDVFANALKEDHELCLAVLQGLVGRMRELVVRVEDLALRPVTARLARFLLEQIEDPALAHPAVTRALIASYLATTPESISRSLRVLEIAGAISFNRHRIVIVDLDILRQQAQL